MLTETKKGTIHSIQLLRGVASLLVVLYHAGENSVKIFDMPFFSGFFHFAYSGVDIFFVLSGFIITYTNMGLLGQKENLVGFLKKRFIRIYPIYWLIISFFIAAQLLASSYYTSQYPFELSTLLSTYLLLPGHIMVNGVSWSLTNELFFYLMFSIAFFVKSKKLLAILLLCFTVFLMAYYMFGYYPDPTKWFLIFLFFMNIEFALGVFAAILYKYIPGKYAIHCIITGILLFLICGILDNREVVLFNVGFDRVIYFGFPSFLIIVGAVAYELKIRASKVHGVLLSLGDASYSLYLLHLPLLNTAFKIMAMKGMNNTVLLHIVIVLVVIVLCAGSIIFFKIVEHPLIRLLNRKLFPKRLEARV